MPADDPRTDDELRAFLRATADSYHHQAGSCRMGTDDLAVVDPQLHVRGVAGLRVADASVMPAVTSGNCHAGILMIAERLSDWLKAEAASGATTTAGVEGMSLAGKKIGILMESDFYEDEIFYYKHRFPEEGLETHFLTRLWGQERITFHGHEYRAPFEVSETFEGMSDDELRIYAAIIVPSAIVSDRLRYTEDVTKLPPATEFLARAFAEKDIVKGIICHGMWLVAPMPELVRGPARRGPQQPPSATCVNMGAIYTDQDVVIDGDLITGRTGGHCHLFARAIIDAIAAKDGAARSGTGAG